MRPRLALLAICGALAAAGCSPSPQTPLFDVVNGSVGMETGGEYETTIGDFAARSDAVIVGTIVGYRVVEGETFTIEGDDLVVYEEIALVEVRPTGESGSIEFEVPSYYSSTSPESSLLRRGTLSLPAGQALFILRRADANTWTCAAELDARCVLQRDPDGSWSVGGLPGEQGDVLDADPVQPSEGLDEAAAVIGSTHGLVVLGTSSGDTVTTLDELVELTDPT